MKSVKHLAHKIVFTWLFLLTATMAYLYAEGYKEKSIHNLEISRLSVQAGYNTGTIEQQKQIIEEMISGLIAAFEASEKQ